MKQATEVHWPPYTPAESSPWNLRRVQHLHRRAGFGADWNALQRDIQAGPQDAVDCLLRGNDRVDDFDLLQRLMELFTLGVGHYSESDVKEVARALTGWTIRDGAFEHVMADHDDGTKQVLGEQGDFDGDDVLAILLKQEPVARRLASRLCDVFFGEEVITDEAVEELASGLREHDLDVHWAVETILRSEAFFADTNIANRVLDPLQFMIGPLRALEMLDPPPSTLLLAEWAAKLGQDLFYPPNVFGWPGGRSWLTTRTMIGRANYVHTLCRGELHRPNRPPAIEALAKKHGYSAPGSRTRFASGRCKTRRRPRVFLSIPSNEELVAVPSTRPLTSGSGCRPFR